MLASITLGDKNATFIIFNPPATYPSTAPSFNERATSTVPRKHARKIPITGIIMTKLDGTAKGGILLAVAKKYKLPIIALGLGEKEDDLQIFEAEKFAEAFTQTN